MAKTFEVVRMEIVKERVIIKGWGDSGRWYRCAWMGVRVKGKETETKEGEEKIESVRESDFQRSVSSR